MDMLSVYLELFQFSCVTGGTVSLHVRTFVKSTNVRMYMCLLLYITVSTVLYLLYYYPVFSMHMYVHPHTLYIYTYVFANIFIRTLPVLSVTIRTYICIHTYVCMYLRTYLHVQVL